MAFKPYAYLKGQPPLLELPAAAASYTVGQALIFSSGKLTTVSTGVGQDIDEGIHYICMEEVTISVAGTTIPVIKADDNIIWETVNGAADTALSVGAKYILGTDANSVIDTSTNGCFLITYTAGTAEDAIAQGIFVE